MLNRSFRSLMFAFKERSQNVNIKSKHQQTENCCAWAYERKVFCVFLSVSIIINCHTVTF